MTNETHAERQHRFDMEREQKRLERERERRQAEEEDRLRKAKEERAFKFFIVKCVVAVVALIAFLMWGMPQYQVYKRTLIGEAELRQAEWNRQILIEEAEAKRIAAQSWAQAEIERARGAAEANRIVAESLGGSEGYLRWLFLEQLSEINGQVIYLPTEAGLPVLEANRLRAAP